MARYSKFYVFRYRNFVVVSVVRIPYSVSRSSYWYAVGVVRMRVVRVATKGCLANAYQVTSCVSSLCSDYNFERNTISRCSLNKSHIATYGLGVVTHFVSLV